MPCRPAFSPEHPMLYCVDPLAKGVVGLAEAVMMPTVTDVVLTVGAHTCRQPLGSEESWPKEHEIVTEPP